MLVSPRVLVVEENHDILEVLKRGLRIAGFDIATFSDPREALKHLQSNSIQPDLVMSDIRMNDIDGIELASKVKALIPDIKVLFLTSSECSDEVFVNKIAPLINVTNNNSIGGKIRMSSVMIQKPARLETIIARVRETLSEYSSIAAPADQEHIVVLYHDGMNLEKKSRYEGVISEYINTGLSKDQLCIYSYIEDDADTAMESLSRKIVDYENNINNGNLMLVDFKPFCKSAINKDMQSFKDLMKLLDEKIANRSDKHVRIVGRAAGWLYENKYFEQCLALEKWWHTKPFSGSLVCPYKMSLFEYREFLEHKDAVCVRHDTILSI